MMINAEFKDDALDIRCPWCNDHVADEEIEFFEGIVEIHCETCGRPVIIHRITTVSYCAVAGADD